MCRGDLFVAADQIECFLDVILCPFRVVLGGGLLRQRQPRHFRQQVIAQAVQVEGIPVVFIFPCQTEDISVQRPRIRKDHRFGEPLQQLPDLR